MKDQHVIRLRLEQLRGQFLQWGVPEIQVMVTTKDELRGWIHALEWVLGARADLRGLRVLSAFGSRADLRGLVGRTRLLDGSEEAGLDGTPAETPSAQAYSPSCLLHC